jgi:hypothetical protein
MSKNTVTDCNKEIKKSLKNQLTGNNTVYKEIKNGVQKMNSNYKKLTSIELAVLIDMNTIMIDLCNTTCKPVNILKIAEFI